MPDRITILGALFVLCSPAFAQDVDLEFVLPFAQYGPGTEFYCDLKIDNPGPALPGSEVFVALTIGTGDYWFYPSWVQYPPNVTSQTLSIGESSTQTLHILNRFIWPAGAGAFDDAAFLGAIVHQGNLVSNLAQIGFAWTDDPPPEMLTIPAGTFTQGSPETEPCRSDTYEVQFIHTISSDFDIMIHEVTQAEWTSVFQINPSHFLGVNLPVELVSWYDACIFANRLSIAHGLTPCYYIDSRFEDPFDGIPYVYSGTVYWKRDADGYRLPTEGESEYFCRAGTTGTFYCNETNYSIYNCYSCSADLAELQKYEHYCYSDTNEIVVVGSKLPNPWGLYDVNGNAGEWLFDWFDDYPAGSVTDYVAPIGVSTANRSLRGGNYAGEPNWCRSAYRYYLHPGSRFQGIGLRLARGPR